MLPVGRYAAHRAVAAPAFAGAAALAIAWDPHVERLPMIIGLCALVAALAAATARSLGREADEALQVWIVAGSALLRSHLAVHARRRTTAPDLVPRS